MLASMKVAGMVANMIAPHSPTAAPKSATPTHRMMAKRPRAPSALGRRVAHSDSPNTVIAAPCSQWNKTGLSMYGTPSSSGTSQLPACSISRVSWA